MNDLESHDSHAQFRGLSIPCFLGASAIEYNRMVRDIILRYSALQECFRHLWLWFVQGAAALGLCFEASVAELIDTA